MFSHYFHSLSPVPQRQVGKLDIESILTSSILSVSSSKRQLLSTIGPALTQQFTLETPSFIALIGWHTQILRMMCYFCRSEKKRKCSWTKEDVNLIIELRERLTVRIERFKIGLFPFFYECVNILQQMCFEHLDCALEIIKTLFLHYGFTVIAPLGHNISPHSFVSSLFLPSFLLFSFFLFYFFFTEKPNTEFGR